MTKINYILLLAITFIVNNNSLAQLSNKNSSINFKVDNVNPADSLLKTFEFKKIIENQLGKEIDYFPVVQNELKSLSLWSNGLIQTIHYAFDEHRPLVLTPDVIWLAICQGTSIHINKNYDNLKDDFFTSIKEEVLYVRNDNLVKGRENWANLIDTMSCKTKNYTKNNFYNFFVPTYSTSTKITKMAYQITLLESYKEKFNYIGGSGCGIPNITLKGQKEDWEKIYNKIDKLKTIGLGDWAEDLKPIIKEFINCYDNKVNTIFWQDIYKNAQEYGGYYISGWIINFYPYLKYTEYPELTDENEDDYAGIFRYKKNEFLGDKNYLLSTLTMGDLPTGIADINLVWDNHFTNTKTDMELYAGFFGIKQNNDMSLEPIISWALCEKNAKKIEQKYYKSTSSLRKTKHDINKFWSPRIISNPMKKAIYDIKRFKTYEASILYLKSSFITNLKENTATKNIDITKYKIKILILSNGTVGKVELTDEYNEQLDIFINQYFKNLNKEWFPALTFPNKALRGGPRNNDPSILVKVHSYVNINFK